MTTRRHLNGRRGVFLSIFGGIWVAIGLSYLFPPPTSSIRHTLEWIPGPESWPLIIIGFAWVCAGVIATVAAWQPLPRDRGGFEALASVAIGWAALNLISWGAGDAVRGWVSALIFSALGAAILTVSGMPNPPHGRIR